MSKNFTSHSFPFAYSTAKNQVAFSETNKAVLGNSSKCIYFYNRNVLSAINKPEKALEIFHDHNLECGVKMSFGNEHFYINGGVVATRSLDVAICLKDGVLYYNTEITYKRGLNAILKEILEKYRGEIPVKPMLTQHINKLFWKNLPDFKFKSIKQMREKFKELGVKFVNESPQIFARV